MQSVVANCSQVVVSLGGQTTRIFEPFNDYSVKGGAFYNPYLRSTLQQFYVHEIHSMKQLKHLYNL